MPAKPSPNAGGAFVALGAIAGAMLGFPFGEATRGLLLGLALGTGAAILVWLRDRGR